MKKKIVIFERNKPVEREVNYIPFRYIFNLLLIFVEIIGVISVVTLLTVYIPYFYFAVIATQLVVAISIVARNDNPDYKLPWLFFVMLIPIVGFMCYFMLYSRKLSKRRTKKIKSLTETQIIKDDTAVLCELKTDNPVAYSQAVLLKNLSASHVYDNTAIAYFSLGDELFPAMITDLERAERFIFMEYFIIECGLFWNKILDVLKRKAQSGIEVRIIYDDIGCMTTLPGNYYKQLGKFGIHCVPFAKIKGQANNEFNNRSHRKITVIDGKVGFTGGVNLADEYINRIEKFGHWKDVGIRLEGEAVNELTRLFLIDYGLNAKGADDRFQDYFSKHEAGKDGYCIPFGDGPKPIFERQVAKTAILNLLGQAERCVYITTPYLIVDSELASALENVALRGIDVRIITPHIPDKKIIFAMTRSSYHRLLRAGVKIFEYEKGFIHAKTYLTDGKIAIVGTTNLDYRSLVHHFENGVWMYKTVAVSDLERDFLQTQSLSVPTIQGTLKQNIWQKFVCALVKIFAPLL